MRTFQALLAALATLLAAISSGVMAASIYRRFKYPQVPVQEADGYFDVGVVFLLTATVVIVAIAGAVVYRARRNRVTPML